MDVSPKFGVFEINSECEIKFENEKSFPHTTMS